MEMGSAFGTLNWWAIIVAAVSTFILGGLWYSKILFARPWMEVSGMTEEKARQSNPAKIFGGSFLLTIIAAVNLALFLGPKSDLAFGIAAGAATGLGWIVPAFGVVYFFEQRPFKQLLINGGYWAIAFTIMGAIIGAWH
jgi:uncharacterized membrane protein